MDENEKAIAEAKRNFSLVDHRDEGISPAFVAVAAAVGTGVQAMSSNGLTIGNAIGTAAGALGAYVVTNAIDASLMEATVIGGLSGSLGVITGNAIDAKLSPAGTSSFNLIKDL